MNEERPLCADTKAPPPAALFVRWGEDSIFFTPLLYPSRSMKWGLGNKESKRWHANRRQGIPFPIIRVRAARSVRSDVSDTEDDGEAVE